MSYISKKDEELLLDIEQFIFTVLNFKRGSFEDEEEFFKTWNDYQKLWNLNERLGKERTELNKIAKVGMQKYRKENPEKAKAYAKEYMKKYRAKGGK